MRRILFLGGALLIGSCSSVDRTAGPNGNDGAAVLSTLQRLGAVSPARPADRPLAASIPLHAAAALRVGDGDAWLEVTPRAMAETALATTPAPGTTVYRAAAPDLDLAYVREAGRVEELRLAHTLAAASSAAWDLRLGPAIASIQIVDGRIEAVDTKGVVRLMSEPAFAIDARGVKRSLHLVLRGRTVEARLDTDGLVAPIAIDPAWVATAKPSSLIRASHSLTRLQSGKVLLAGGVELFTDARTSSAELYDPATNTWATTGSLASPRSEHTTTWYGGTSKKAVVVGGYGIGTFTTAEVYDEATGKFEAPVSLPASSFPTYGLQAARRGHAAVRLPSGDVLAVGGQSNSGYFDSIVLFPVSGGVPYNLSAKLTFGTQNPMAVTLDDGRVLIAGGFYAGGSSDKISQKAYLLTVTSTGSSIAAAANMPVARYAAATAVVGSGPNKGKAIFVGGGIASAASESSANPSQGGIVFDPAAGSWTPLPYLMAYARMYTSGGLLTANKFLITGGSTDNALAASANPDGEVLDLNTFAWNSAGLMVEPRAVHVAETLADGSMLLVGGVRGVRDGILALTVGPERFTLQSAGAACSADGQCTSGFCVDGVCCDTACAGQCEACDLAGSVGTCKPTTGAPHGKRDKCAASGGDSVCGQACDGADTTKCNYAAKTKACGVDACAAGKETKAGNCDGAGACDDKSKLCGDYVCDAKACKTACTTKADCANASHFCEAGKCIPQQASGSACSRDEACATGICVDSTCCETRCDGQCQACDVPGLSGKCSPVKGKPHGTRKDCDKDATDACKSKSCDGTNATACAASIGPCVGNFTCDDEAKVCKKLCVADLDCSTGFECEKTGKCIPRTSKCVDTTEVQNADGSRTKCVGFTCAEGACQTKCTSTTQCQNGFACDSGSCVPTTTAAPTTDSGGGCATVPARPGPTNPWWSLLALAALAGRRVRRP